MNKRKTGSLYEAAAASYLIKKGYNILEKNFRVRIGEIDLIAMDGEYLVFVEVKYRRNSVSGTALEAVDERKQQIIRRTAEVYLSMHPHFSDAPCRFDVVGIMGNQIEHIKNAF